MFSFSGKSLTRLRECDPKLQRILFEVIKYYDCTILTGHRGQKLQDSLFKENKSKVVYPNSKHNTFPSMAVDVSPWPIPNNWGSTSWKDKVKFYELKAIIMFVAARNGVEIRWGGDWDMDNDYKDQKFDDLLHFEVL